MESRTSTVVESKRRLTSKRNFVLDSTFLNFRLCTVMFKTIFKSKRIFKNHLTRNGGGNYWMHPKIWCLNFKPQYLQNYVSPTNDLYSVRKRSIRAFKSIFKLLGWGHWLRTLRQNFARVVSLAAVQLVLKHARAPFDLILSPVV